MTTLTFPSWLIVLLSLLLILSSDEAQKDSWQGQPGDPSRVELEHLALTTTIRGLLTYALIFPRIHSKDTDRS